MLAIQQVARMSDKIYAIEPGKPQGEPNRRAQALGGLEGTELHERL